MKTKLHTLAAAILGERSISLATRTAAVQRLYILADAPAPTLPGFTQALRDIAATARRNGDANLSALLDSSRAVAANLCAIRYGIAA